MIYAGSRKNAERAREVVEEAGITCGVYHAGLRPEERHQVQEEFLSGALPVVAATNAFGMGIDREDVRLVVHVDVPGSLEAYYQEIGRAGRDGAPADAVLLFTEASVRLQEFFLDLSHPDPNLIRAVWDLLVVADAEGHLPTSPQLAAALGEEPPRLEAALNRLIGAGLVRRLPEGCYGLVEESGVSFEEALDPRSLRARRRADEEKLASILSYARTRRCRRDVILRYFESDELTGDEDGAGCGRCDVCAAPAAAGRALDEAETIELQKILSGVVRARGRAGRAKIVGMLVGARTKDLVGTWLGELSTYGILAELGREGVSARLDVLQDAGLVEAVGDRYPVLQITARGWSVLRGEEAVLLPWPEAARGGIVPSSARGGGRGAGGTADPFAALGAKDRAVAEVLRRWRQERAREEGVPAYLLFNNRSLAELAVRRPRTLEALADVHGFGPVKIEGLGAAVLGALEEALALSGPE